MYESYYGFKEKPFALTPDPGFLYLSTRHKAALNILECGVTNQAGFVVISGEVGSGKTILIRQFLKQVESDVTIGTVTNTHSKFGELLKWILLAFGLNYKPEDKLELYHLFVAFLAKEYGAGRRVVLIVDEAQNLDIDTLEELRILSNVNTDKDQFVQIVLVGQPELIETLKRPELRQLAQRVSFDYKLLPLTLEETRTYIGHRLKVAGGNPDLFDEMAWRTVHLFSSGIPRLINILCDTALVYGFAEDVKRIGYETIVTVVEDKCSSGLNTFADVVKGLSPEEIARRMGFPRPLVAETSGTAENADTKVSQAFEAGTDSSYSADNIHFNREDHFPNDSGRSRARGQ